MKKLMEMVKERLVNAIFNFGDLNTMVCCLVFSYEPEIPSEIEQ